MKTCYFACLLPESAYISSYSVRNFNGLCF